MPNLSVANSETSESAFLFSSTKPPCRVPDFSNALTSLPRICLDGYLKHPVLPGYIAPTIHKLLSH
jgi:hypothetical protein